MSETSNVKVEAFRSSCRFYLPNKKMYEMKPDTDENRRYLQYIHDNIQFVESTFERIREKCGTNARLILYLLFVEERTQQDIADLFHMSRRQLQYSVQRWLYILFGSG